MLNRYDLFGRFIAGLAYRLARLLSSLELGVIEHGNVLIAGQRLEL